MSCISATASAITRQFSPSWVGATGSVTAIEYNAELAARAGIDTDDVGRDSRAVAVHHADMRRRDAARGCMARPPVGRGKVDPAVGGGCISEPRCAAGSRVPDRAARPGIFGAPDLWGRDLSL